MKKFGLLGNTAAKPAKAPITTKTVRAAPQMKAKTPGKPKRPTGQFQSARESEGKINGGGYGDAVAPASHDAFHRLGSK